MKWIRTCRWSGLNFGQVAGQCIVRPPSASLLPPTDFHAYLASWSFCLSWTAVNRRFSSDVVWQVNGQHAVQHVFGRWYRWYTYRKAQRLKCNCRAAWLSFCTVSINATIPDAAFHFLVLNNPVFDKAPFRLRVGPRKQRYLSTTAKVQRKPYVILKSEQCLLNLILPMFATQILFNTHLDSKWKCRECAISLGLRLFDIWCSWSCPCEMTLVFNWTTNRL